MITEEMVEAGVEEIRKAKHTCFDRWTDHEAIRAVLEAAAAETIAAISAENDRLRKALEPFARFFKSELHDLSPASDATVFAAFQDQKTGAPLADLSIADVRRAYALLAAREVAK